jgi:hypothetical protein
VIFNRTAYQRQVIQKQAGNQGTDVTPLTHRIPERYGIPEQPASRARLDFQMGMKDRTCESLGNRQADDVGWLGGTREHESAVERRRDVIRMRRSATRDFPAHRALEKQVEGCRSSQQFVGRHEGRDCGRTAASKAAGKRQPLVNPQPDATCSAEPLQQRLNGSACGVLRWITRQLTTIPLDSGNFDNPGFPSLGDDDITWRIKRKAEDIEPAADV